MAIVFRDSVDPLSRMSSVRRLVHDLPSSSPIRLGRSLAADEGRTVKLSCDAGPHGRYSPPISSVGVLDTNEDFMTAG